MASTTLDALVAEMLGDVGKLHDSLTELGQQLPELTRQTGETLSAIAEQAEKRVELVLGQLVGESAQIRSLIEQHVGAAQAASAAALEDNARQLVERVVTETGSQLGTTASRAVSAALGTEVQQATGRIERAAAALTTASQAFSAALWQRIATVALAAFLAALLGAGAALLAAKYVQPRQDLSAEQAQLIRDGQAFRNVWSKLDAKTQQRLNDLAKQ